MGKSKRSRKKVIGVIDFEDTIRSILDTYGNDIYEVTGDATQFVAEEAAKKLQAGGDFGGTGAYNRDWVAESVQKTRVLQKFVVHNLRHYRLAHLLEKGHVSRNGTGREFHTDKAPVRAFEHIKPVEEWAIQELPRKVEELINRI